jgi:hypothetical protein
MRMGLAPPAPSVEPFDPDFDSRITTMDIDLSRQPSLRLAAQAISR